MINQHLVNELLKNWDAAKVEALEINVIARVEHPSYPIEWYLLALNPEDELCTAIINHNQQPAYVEIAHIYLGDLAHVFTTQGLEFKTDKTFRKQSALRLWNRLRRITEGQYNAA